MTAELFTLTDDHAAVREAIREIAEGEIRPFAADVDERERYPVEAQKALTAAGFQAVHIPEDYDGAGADAVATVIVIEEVARVCASSSLIPAVNKLGSMPIILSGSEELKQLVLPSIAVRRGDDLLRAVRAGGRLGCGGDAHQGGRRRRRLGAQRHQVLDHQCRGVQLVHGDGGDRPGEERQGNLGVRRARRRPRLRRRDQGTQARHQGLADPGNPFRELPDPGNRIIGEPGTGFSTAMATLDHTRPTIGAQAVGIAQGALDVAVGYVKERKQFGKHWPSSRACSS